MSAHAQPSPDFLQLIGHSLRWQLVSALARTDLHVQELVDLVNESQNLVSYHLRKLRLSGLVHERRSIADAREVYYSLDLERMRRLYFAAGSELHPALSEPDGQPTPSTASDRKLRVLFLCTHNSARSQIAEGILRSKSSGLIEVFSAGTEATRIHPLAIQAMQAHQIDISGQHSKNMEQFLDQSFDYIITVCDRAKESCPVFPGDPVRIHWSFPDPAAVEGPERVRYQAFIETTVQMITRISYLTMMIERTHGVQFS
jgi:ArsR family transcriptional regulator, arsenate/arsenite/antimonite-responsive transcriptional repressor / arsenate reductase (thioredoxin)